MINTTNQNAVRKYHLFQSGGRMVKDERLYPDFQLMLSVENSTSKLYSPGASA
jgi:hypothetical protein